MAKDLNDCKERHYYRFYDGKLSHANSIYGQDKIDEFMERGFTTPNRPHNIPHNPTKESLIGCRQGWLVSYDKQLDDDDLIIYDEI